MDQLKELLHARRLKVSGRKAELIDRLVGAAQRLVAPSIQGHVRARTHLHLYMHTVTHTHTVTHREHSSPVCWTVGVLF